MNLLNKLTKMLKKLSKMQRMVLAVALGYFLYVTYIKVEQFVNEGEDGSEEGGVPDEVIETGMFDNLLSNVGLKNEKLLKQERQEEAKKDNYNMYEGSDEGERKARAIADHYKKY